MYEASMKTFMHEQVSKLPERLDEIPRENYIREVQEYNKNMHKTLKDGFGMTSEELFEFLSSSESSVNGFCSSELK